MTVTTNGRKAFHPLSNPNRIAETRAPRGVARHGSSETVWPMNSSTAATPAAPAAATSAARAIGRHRIAAQVAAASTRRQRHVEAIVDDNAGATAGGEPHDIGGETCQIPGFQFALPHLEKIDAGINGEDCLVE